MPSIIVFSKDRPMQLHAYIESLLKYSNITEWDIRVIYKHSPQISYNKTISSYPNIIWDEEKNFYEQLLAAIDKSKNHIMFGCDDVLFTNILDLNRAEQYLDNNKNIFGFTFRLGKNINCFPENAIQNEDIYTWEWQKATSHFAYPWEVSATIYRKNDIIKLLNIINSKPSYPNPLEADIAKRPEIIPYSFLACYEKSSMLTITVNRVQNEYLNSFDDNLLTDINYLNTLYNVHHETLDIEKISSLSNSDIHVGADYFILRGNNKLLKKENLLFKLLKKLFFMK